MSKIQVFFLFSFLSLAIHTQTVSAAAQEQGGGRRMEGGRKGFFLVRKIAKTLTRVNRRMAKIKAHGY